MNKLSYEGYLGTIEVSIEDNCLHGRILFIDDIITYEGSTIDDIKSSFEEAVDDYLAYCEETGVSADKPYSGSFNVRVGQELHREAAKTAFNNDMSLNEFVTQSIKISIEQNRVIKVEHSHQHTVTIKTDSQEHKTLVTSTGEQQSQETVYAPH